MASVAELILLIQGKDDASKAIKSVKDSVKEFGIEVLKVSTGVAGGLGMYDAAQEAVAVVKTIIASAAEAEQMQVRLRSATEAAGLSWELYGGSLNRAADATLRLGFSDEVARDALSLLVTQTGNAEAAQSRLTLAMDVSRGTHLDLYTAAKLVGRVTDENINVLSRYGVTIREGASETEALALIQQKFGGQAGNYAQTAAGQWAIFTQQVGELGEVLGTAVLPILTTGLSAAIPVVIGLADAFRFLTQVVKDMVAPLEEVGGGLGILGDAATYLPGPLGTVANAIKVAQEASKGLGDEAESAAESADTFGQAEQRAAASVDYMNSLLEKQINNLGLTRMGFEASVPGIEAHLLAIQAINDAYGQLPQSTIEYLLGGPANTTMAAGSFSMPTPAAPEVTTNIDTQVSGGVLINGPVTVNQAAGESLDQLLARP